MFAGSGEAMISRLFALPINPFIRYAFVCVWRKKQMTEKLRFAFP